MSSRPEQNSWERKIALIFVWSQFQDLSSRVEAGMKDRNTMRVFWESLGFEVTVFHNCLKSRFEEEINEVKTNYEKNEYSCLAVVVSTHGHIYERKTNAEPSGNKFIHQKLIIKGGYEESNDCLLLDDDLIYRFDSPEVDAPKIFVIQSCRKIKQEPDESNPSSSDTETSQPEDANAGVDIGIKVREVDGIEDEYQETYENNSHGQPSESEEEKPIYCPPCVKNSIVVYSSPIGYASFCGNQGSTLLTTLSEQLKEEKSGEFSFTEFITKVKHRLSKRVADESSAIAYRSVASVTHRLTADIRLNKQNQ